MPPHTALGVTLQFLSFGAPPPTPPHWPSPTELPVVPVPPVQPRLGGRFAPLWDCAENEKDPPAQIFCWQEDGQTQVGILTHQLVLVHSPGTQFSCLQNEEYTGSHEANPVRVRSWYQHVCVSLVCHLSRKEGVPCKGSAPRRG